MLSRERYWVIDVRQFMRALQPDMKPTLKQQRSKESTLWPSTYAPQFISASHKIPDEIFTWALQQFRILYPTRCMIVILISKPHTNNQGRSPSAISKIQGTVRNGRRSLDMEALGARRRRWTPDLYDRWPMADGEGPSHVRSRAYMRAPCCGSLQTPSMQQGWHDGMTSRHAAPPSVQSYEMSLENDVKNSWQSFEARDGSKWMNWSNSDLTENWTLIR
jgi:hypothetical protein